MWSLLLFEEGYVLQNDLLLLLESFTVRELTVEPVEHLLHAHDQKITNIQPLASHITAHRHLPQKITQLGT